MKELISKQLVTYLENRGVEHLRSLWSYVIAFLAELEKSKKINYCSR